MYLKISRQGLTGARELRKRVRPNGAAAFSAPAERGTRTALACSPLTGGKFSAEPQRGIRRLRTAGTCRAPRRGKRVDTKVSTLLTPTSFYFLVWRRPETGDRFENRERQRFFSSAWTRLARHVSAYSQSQIPYCYTGRLLSASATQGELPEGQERGPWGILVSRNSSVWR